MAGFIGRLGLRSGLLLVAILAAAGGIAYAAIPDSAGVYTACKLNATGAIRLIDPSLPASTLLGHCTSQETQINWNQKGQQGPQGIQGPQGPQGPEGTQGPPGNDGKDGSNGVSGYYVQWNYSYVSGSGDVHWLYAYCNHNYGDKALGGGYVITSGSGDRNNTVVTESAPYSNGTAWEATMINNNTEYFSDGNVNFYVYATCAKAN